MSDRGSEQRKGICPAPQSLIDSDTLDTLDMLETQFEFVIHGLQNVYCDDKLICDNVFDYSKTYRQGLSSFCQLVYEEPADLVDLTNIFERRRSQHHVLTP